MSLKDIKDKLEIGLKPDAPYRPANLPDSMRPHPPHPPGTDPAPEDTDDKPAAGRPAPTRDDTR
jgi:hypothetical protein